MRWTMRALTLGLGAALLTGLVGCPFSTDPTPPPPPAEIFKPRTSPENLLYNMKVAYERRDVTEYDSLLDAEFEFFLSEDDQHIADRFTRWQEIEIHQNMFNADLVTSLRLTFDDIDASDVELDEEKSSPGNDIYTATVSNIDITLTGTTPQHPNEAPSTYQMTDGASQFWFRQKSWKHKNGEPIWKIVEWLELSAGD